MFQTATSSSAPDTAMVPSWLNVTFALGDAIKPNVLSSVYL